MNIFPIRVPMSGKSIDNLKLCEEGSWEDLAREKGVDEGLNRFQEGEAHTHEICERHRTFLEIRNEHELKDVIYSLETGTFSIWHPRICDRILYELHIKSGFLPI